MRARDKEGSRRPPTPREDGAEEVMSSHLQLAARHLAPGCGLGRRPGEAASSGQGVFCSMRFLL